jgi:TonB-linked outer membrane protein, SusC/RagA family
MEISFFILKPLFMSIANYLLKQTLKLNLKVFLLGLFVFSWATLLTAQTKVQLHGKVVDQAGKPVAFASVKVKGTNTGVNADESGVFNLSVLPGKTLIVSAVGHATKDVSVPQTGNTIDIVLPTITSELDQVIVIGYGTQRKEAVTGSVASIKGDVVREVPSANITQALQGRVAGVQISQTDSKPGATMQIRVRGTRSLTADNNPLIVMDGIPFPGTLADIDVSEIKSIDILKDASATAIYGSRGANGVVLITTNKGQMGQKPHISYNGYVGLKNVIKYPMMNAAEFNKLRKEASSGSNGYAYWTSPGKDEDTSGKTNTDWQDLLFQTGIVTSHDVNITGATEKGNYQFGGTYYHDQGVIPMQWYTRYSLHGAVDQEVGRFIKLGFSTNNNYAINNGNSLSAGTALSMTPIASPYRGDGSIKRSITMTNDANWTYTKKTLEALGDNYADLTRAFSSYNSVYGELKIPGVQGLKYRINIGLNYRQNNYGYFQGYGVFNATDSLGISSANISNSHTINWAIENLLTYDRTFAGKHRINATALYSSEQTTYWYSTVSATGIQNSAFQFYNIGASTDVNGAITVNPSYQSYYQKGLVSYMGRIMYSYNDKYMLSATLRSDGSSVLAPGYKWHTYTAFSAGWNIMKESFMKDVSFVDNLKLRVGYGQTSNQSVNSYSTLGTLSSAGYNYGTAYSTGYYVTTLPNPKLGWEYSKTWNFAADFTLLKNRLSGTIEYYSVKTSNVLWNLTLPVTTGASSVTQNVANTQNKGIELTLNGTIIENKKGWSWDAGINVYANRNKITSLASGYSYDKSNYFFVGHPIDVFYDYQKIGLYNTAQDSINGHLATLVPGGNVGMIKVKYYGTYKSDGTPTRKLNDDSDRMPIDIQPHFEGGFNTRIGYKNFDITIIGSFKSGGILNSTLYGNTGYLNMESGRRENIKIDYWTKTHTNAKYPWPGGIVNSNNPYYGSTLGYFSASYIKVSTVTLGYNFNQKWLKAAGIERMRVYFTAQGPLLVMCSPYYKESHMDPQPNTTSTNYQASSSIPYRLLVVGQNTPSTRNYIVGLNVTF